MLNEGFYDLTSGDTNCILNSATFTAQVTVSGVTQENEFYRGYYLNEYPSDSLFYDTVYDLLISYEGIGEVTIDYINNIITISTDCNSSVSLTDADVKIELKISYDINCETCNSSFISVWRTTTPFESITLPYDPSGTYDGAIDWGDGVLVDNDYGNITHTYEEPGYYLVSISGIIDGFSFTFDDSSSTKFIEIQQWGNLKLSNTGLQFKSCFNLSEINANDTPNLTSITYLDQMFNNCLSLTLINNINSWNVSNITKMQYMFYGTLFNQDIGGWDVSNVNNMEYMFNYATLFNQDLSSWCVTLIPFSPTDFDTGATSWVLPRPDWGNCPI
jgi:surface protein